MDEQDDALKEQVHVLSVGYRADATDADLREMARTADPVGEMTRQLRESQAPYQPLPVPDVVRSLREESIASQIPESVATIPRNIAATIPESVLDSMRSRSAVDAAANPGGAFGAALRDLDRLNRLSGR